MMYVYHTTEMFLVDTGLRMCGNIMLNVDIYIQILAKLSSQNCSSYSWNVKIDIIIADLSKIAYIENYMVSLVTL